MLKKYQLRNKIKVLLQESHRSPVVSIQVWVRTGSADELPGQEGLTHFIEHLLFKGTEKFETAEIAKKIEGSGGELNAYTSFDQTVYYITISSKYAPLAVEALGEMLGAPKFDKAEIDNERGVVLEEIKRSNDSPSRVSGNLLFSTIYQNHPYGRPVIGFPKVVETASRDQVLELFHSRYSPENVYVVAVGDFDSSDMHKLIEKNFVRVQGKKKNVKRPLEPVQKEPRVSVKEGAVSEVYINFGWRIPPKLANHLEELDLLSILLGGGDSSRLVQRLRLEKPLSTSIGAYMFHSDDPGFFSISATLNAENVETLLEEIGNVITEIKTESPTINEINNAIVNIESSEIYGFQSVENIANRIGRYQHLFGDPEYFQKYLKNIRKVKGLVVSKVARELLNTANLTVTALVPKGNANVESLVQDWVRSFDYANDFVKPTKIFEPPKQAKPKIKLKVIEPSERAHTKQISPKGSKIIYQTSTDTSVVSVQLGFLGGLRGEKKETFGLGELMSATWAAGTESKTEKEIIDFFESRAAFVRPFSGRNSFGVSFEMLKEFEKDVADVVSEIVTTQVFDKEILERERNVQLDTIRTQVDRPSQIVYYEFLEKMFAGHPYAFNPTGTKETAQNVSRDDILAYLEKYRTTANMTAVVTGGADARLWESVFSKISNKLETGKLFEKSIRPENISTDLTTFRSSQKEQSHIIYGFRGIDLVNPRRFTLQVLQSILSGQGGRLFYNLREKASLAYTVSPIRMDGLDTGCFGAYIGCSPEKTKTAIDMLKNEFDNLVQKRVSDLELDRAKKYLIGRHDIGLQRTSAIASSILFTEIYGLDSEEIYRFAEHTHAVSAEDIQKLAEDLFTQHSVTCIVGSQNPF